MREQLNEYYPQEEELRQFYSEKAQVVDGDQDPHMVFESLESRIVNPLPVTYSTVPAPSSGPGSRGLSNLSASENP